MALAIAVVGVAGTLTAPILSQIAATQARAAEAKLQRQDRADEEHRLGLVEKREVYAELNAAAGDFRTACHDRLRAARRGDVSPLPDVEEARLAFRSVYAQAQMIMPDRALTIAYEANHCLTQGYRLVKDISPDVPDAVRDWFEGPNADAVRMLRKALRADLGVAAHSPDIDEQFERLRAARLALPAEAS